MRPLFFISILILFSQAWALGETQEWSTAVIDTTRPTLSPKELAHFYSDVRQIQACLEEDREDAIALTKRLWAGEMDHGGDASLNSAVETLTQNVMLLPSPFETFDGKPFIRNNHLVVNPACSRMWAILFQAIYDQQLDPRIPVSQLHKEFADSVNETYWPNSTYPMVPNLGRWNWSALYLMVTNSTNPYLELRKPFEQIIPPGIPAADLLGYIGWNWLPNQLVELADPADVAMAMLASRRNEITADAHWKLPMLTTMATPLGGLSVDRALEYLISVPASRRRGAYLRGQRQKFPLGFANPGVPTKDELELEWVNEHRLGFGEAVYFAANRKTWKTYALMKSLLESFFDYRKRYTLDENEKFGPLNEDLKRAERWSHLYPLVIQKKTPHGNVPLPENASISPVAPAFWDIYHLPVVREAAIAQDRYLSIQGTRREMMETSSFLATTIALQYVFWKILKGVKWTAEVLFPKGLQEFIPALALVETTLSNISKIPVAGPLATRYLQVVALGEAIRGQDTLTALFDSNLKPNERLWMAWQSQQDIFLLPVNLAGQIVAIPGKAIPAFRQAVINLQQKK